MNILTEKLQSLIPQYPVNIAGKDFTLRLDVNTNKTKKGVKLQFVSNDLPQDPRLRQELANKIGTELQTNFGQAGMQIIYDLENPYNNVIGFLIPLPSIGNYLMSTGLSQTGGQEQEPESDEEQSEEQPEELPAQEEPPSEEEEAIREIFRMRAGIKAKK